MSDQDADLVLRTLAGDRSAFEALVATHLARAQAMARAVLGASPMVDDVVQESLIRAYERLGQLSDPRTFPAWLGTIIRNEAITWLRRAGRARQVDLSHAEIAIGVPPAAANPDSDRVAAAMARLPSDYREILALKYQADCDYERIAETLGITVANVEKRLYRARQALIKLLPDLVR